MGMGRKRKDRKDLPERMYFRGRAYYFVERSGKWRNLGRDFQKALTAYGAFVDTQRGDATLGAVMDRYERDVLPTKAARTREQYGAALKLLRAVFGACAPGDITPAHIYTYLDRRPRVAGNREKAVLSNVYTFAVRLGVVHANPCKQVRRNPEPARDRFVSQAEIDQVRALASPVQRVAIDLAVTTGLRLGDLIALRWGDWKEDGLHVRTGKTGRYLLFAPTPELAEILQGAKALSRTVFGNTPILPAQGGTRYSASGFKSGWQRLMRKVEGIERFHFHDLRAVAASRSETPQELLGHDDPRTTNRVYRRGPRTVKPATLKR